MYNNVYDLQTLYLIIMFKSAPSEDKTPYGRPLALWILRGGLGGMCLGMGMERDDCHEAQARIHGHHEAWKLGVCSPKGCEYRGTAERPQQKGQRGFLLVFPPCPQAQGEEEDKCVGKP